MTNFAGAESVSDVAAGVLSFSYKHELAEMAVQDLRANYKGYDWGWNGPGVITRVLRKYCRTCKVSSDHRFNWIDIFLFGKKTNHILTKNMLFKT